MSARSREEPAAKGWRGAVLARLADGGPVALGLAALSFFGVPQFGLSSLQIFAIVIVTYLALSFAADALLKSRLRSRWRSFAAGLVAGLASGVLLGALTEDLFKVNPFTDDPAPSDGPGFLDMFTAIDFIALGLGFMMVMTFVGSMQIGLSKKPVKGMPPMSRSDKRMYAWAGPSYLAEGLALLALLYGRMSGEAVIAGVVAAVAIAVAAGLLLFLWAKMDEFNRAFSLEVFGWSFLILFFAAPVWAALNLVGIAPAMGAYEGFVVMNAVYLAVTIALFQKRHGDGAFAADDDEVEDDGA